MKKTIILSLLALVFAFTSAVKADISLSGYAEFFAGSANQDKYQGVSGAHGLDKAGLKNGQYTRITANYGSTLDSGIEVAGTMNMTTRDCQGNKTGNCDVVNMNFMTFSGGFGSVSIGERHDAGAVMLSRITASGPMSEPDGGVIGQFYTGDTANDFGAGNETSYANNSMKAVYMSNVFSGFSFAAAYTPNVAEDGSAIAGTNPGVGDFGEWASHSDVLSVFGKYTMEMDGIGLTLVYGQMTGNSGQSGGNNYNDLDESAYSALITYGNFAADYRKNEAGNSGRIKNGQDGNDEGTSICGTYTMGNIGLGACNVETSFTDTSNRSNSSQTRTYSAEYQLGGGVTLGVTYFDVEQTANSLIRTDVDGVATRLAIGF
jgi:hypothetical protein